MRISAAARDELSQVAADLGGVTLDAALRAVIFQHRTLTATARLAADPAALADYQTEAAELAEVDVTPVEW